MFLEEHPNLLPRLTRTPQWWSDCHQTLSSDSDCDNFISFPKSAKVIDLETDLIAMNA